MTKSLTFKKGTKKAEEAARDSLDSEDGQIVLSPIQASPISFNRQLSSPIPEESPTRILFPEIGKEEAKRNEELKAVKLKKKLLSK